MAISEIQHQQALGVIKAHLLENQSLRQFYVTQLAQTIEQLIPIHPVQAKILAANQLGAMWQIDPLSFLSLPGGDRHVGR